jgi:hypothetical protein
MGARCPPHPIPGWRSRLTLDERRRTTALAVSSLCGSRGFPGSCHRGPGLLAQPLTEVAAVAEAATTPASLTPPTPWRPRGSQGVGAGKDVPVRARGGSHGSRSSPYRDSHRLRHLVHCLNHGRLRLDVARPGPNGPPVLTSSGSSGPPLWQILAFMALGVLLAVAIGGLGYSLSHSRRSEPSPRSHPPLRS